MNPENWILNGSVFPLKKNVIEHIYHFSKCFLIDKTYLRRYYSEQKKFVKKKLIDDLLVLILLQQTTNQI